MMSARAPAITLLCFLIGLLTLTSTPRISAADRLEVRIRSNILNIRETTSTKSPIVDVLQQGEVITVTTTGLADWIRLDDGRGYISIHYVDVLNRTPVIESPAEAAEHSSPAQPDQAAEPTAAVTQTTPEPPVPAAPQPATDTPASNSTTPATDTSAPAPIAPPAPAPAPAPANASEPSTSTVESPVSPADRVTSTAPSDAAPQKPTPQPAPVCAVTADTTELYTISVATTCRRNLKTLFYEACEVTFNLEFISSCDQPGELNIRCSAVAQTADINRRESLVELSQEATIFLKEKTKVRQKLIWMPTGSGQQINDIQLREKQCTLN